MTKCLFQLFHIVFVDPTGNEWIVLYQFDVIPITLDFYLDGFFGGGDLSNLWTGGTGVATDIYG